MQKLVALIILIGLVSAKYKPELKGDAWQSKSAQEKFDVLRSKIDKTKGTHGKWPSALQSASLFTQDNNNSFLTQDEMPTQGLWNSKRPKLIHVVGSIAEMEYVPVTDKYSGIFEKGATKGFGRFSFAAQPSEHNIAPGMTFKWLRDGKPSANWFCLHALQGFDNDSNVFAKDFTNHIPNLNRSFDLSKLKYVLLIKSFEKASDWPAFAGLNDTAMWDQQGNKSEKVNFPFRLQFQPTKEARNLMPSDLKVTDYYYLPLIEGWKIDTLFNVYAQETPDSEDVELIGHVKMKTPFRQSSYIDETMYFQHVRFDEDLKLKPEMKEGAQKVWDWQEKQNNYVYPNIPYE